MRLFSAFLILLAPLLASACDLCAIYSADDALGAKGKGFSIAVSEQFIPYRTVQFESEEVHPTNPSYYDSSITHVVLGYNFSPSFSLNFNLPIEHINFRRTDFEYFSSAPPEIITEKDTEFGIGDAALIARVTLFSKREMEWSLGATLLAGVKFPTGDSSRIEDEVEQGRIFESLLPPGTPHDPLGHSISSVHQHDLALGSGSYDGIFGFTLNGRWDRWFLNAQVQYYLRTEGESDFEYGDELLVSGGPGLFLVATKNWSMSLAANALYDTMARDKILGRKSDRTGSTGWYFGPLMNFTYSDWFAANVGIDLPLHIQNNGLQSVPEYRLHGGFSFRF